MTVLERISTSFRATFFPKVVPPLQAQPLSLRDPRLADFLSPSPATDTGVTVNETTALHYPAVWAAVQTIAGDVASLPFFHYQQKGERKERYTTSKLYRVLHDEFNPDMSAMVGRETMTAHLLLWGNAYAEIVRNDLGQVVALFPIEPNRVMPDRTESGRIIYRVQAGDGREVLVPTERMLHVVGLGWNGLMGYSVIGMMRNSLGMAIATEQLGGQVMSRGATYRGFLEHPRTLGATAHKNLKESLATDLSGSYRILEEGMTYKPASMSLTDAQFLETRKFSVTDIARMFGLPPHKLGDLERATFSNIEEQNIDYVIGTLRRWLVRWEQECNRKLIAPLEKTLQWCEHLVDALLRGNTESRYRAYTAGVQGAILKINEARRAENLDPVEGGDELIVQGAMVPLARLNDLVDKLVRPPPAPIVQAPADDEPEAPDDRVAQLALELRAESRAAGLALVAGKLVRKELAQLRKRVADPTAAVFRLERFYRRFVQEGAAELTPWVGNPVTRARVLETWAARAMRACVETLQRGTFAAMVQEWEQDREAALRRMLQEAIDG